MRAVCIDDEQLALNYITQQLNKVEDVEVIGAFQYPMEGLQFILEKDVDVVFLDIQIPGMTGIELAERIMEKKPHLDIVFVTAYSEYAVTAFDLEAIDYLVKPIKLDRLKKTIDRLRKTTTEKTENDQDKSGILKMRVGQNLAFAFREEAFKPLKWRTAKGRELFLYLLQNHGTLVHKATILELLWGEDELDKGYSILYTTVYNVRKILVPYEQHLELTNTNDGYMLNLHDVEIDLREWEKGLAKLPEISQQSIEQYENIMQLNSGPYLGDFDYIWVESEKQRLEQIWLEHAQKIAAYYRENYHVKEAAHWYSLIVERIPEMEDAHFQLMQLYADAGRKDLLKQQYERLTRELDLLGVSPSVEVTEWYKQAHEESLS